MRPVMGQGIENDKKQNSKVTNADLFVRGRLWMKIV